MIEEIHDIKAEPAVVTEPLTVEQEHERLEKLRVQEAKKKGQEEIPSKENASDEEECSVRYNSLIDRTDDYLADLSNIQKFYENPDSKETEVMGSTLPDFEVLTGELQKFHSWVVANETGAVKTLDTRPLTSNRMNSVRLQRKANAEKHDAGETNVEKADFAKDKDHPTEEPEIPNNTSMLK